MFHRITCPTCQHKFSVPEAAMGQRQTCPNCQSLFQAGKSVAEAEVPMKLQAAAPPAPGGTPLNKTLLADTEPPIKYNCPRCKKPLESPVSEAGTKKPCPACGGRLQVPAAPRSATLPNPLNKTILASDENAAMQAGPPPTAAPPPVPGAAANIAMAPPAPAHSPLSSPIVLVGLGLGGVIVLGLLACVITMFLGGGERERVAKEKQAEYEKARAELEEIKRSIQQNEALMSQKRLLEADHNKKWEDFMEKQRIRQREIDAERDRDLAQAKDAEARDRLKEKRRLEQEELARIERDRLAEKAKADNELKAEIARLKAQVDSQNQAAQQRTVIVSQPPPVYYPPYHYRYYWGY